MCTTAPLPQAQRNRTVFYRKGIRMARTVSKSTVSLDPVQIRILQTVADAPNSTISHVVTALIDTFSENTIRSGVRHLLSKRYLDGGRATSEIRLRLTSNGRVALDMSVT